MNETATKSEADRHQHGTIVSITVDGDAKEIPDGVYKVSDLKTRYGIPAEYVLNEVTKDGTFKPLNDERSVHIQGGEKFVSQLPQGGSS